jgi:UDP-2-acetamido-3-amino-2,3-dideoxy-glucuronate N-acetyltransferase
LPNQVRCIGEAYLNQGVADVTLTTLRFPGGVNAHVHVSWINPFKEQKLTVVGSHGMLVFDDTLPWKEKLLFYRQPLLWSGGQVPVANKSLGEEVDVPEDEPLRIECRHFLECCDQRKEPITDGREGLRVLQVLNAAQQSLEKNGEAANPLFAIRHSSPSSNANVSVSQLSVFQVSDFFSHPTAIIDDGAHIGEGSRIWHWAHVCSGAQIGKGVSLGQNVFVGSKANIGDRCKIQNNVSVYDNVTLEEGVFCGPSMVFTNVYNPRALIERKDEYRDTLVKTGATLGANCTIVCGITIGEYAFIGAGSVVNKDVKPFALMVGVPARQIGWMSKYGEQIPLPLEGSGNYKCPHALEKYALKDGFLFQVEV